MAAKPAPSLQDILDQMDEVEDQPVELGRLPPLIAAEAIRRSKPTHPVPDLTALAKLLALFGEGNTGKTMFARYMVERMADAGKLGSNVVAALAPGNRNLLDFAPGTMQPPDVDPKNTATWATKLLTAMQKKGKTGGVWDFGGGDSSARHMLGANPNLAADAEERGLAIVPVYLLSPRLDDLVFLSTFESMGFQPRATALVLNLARADGPSAFNDIRRQPEYKAALDRGAVELWMPALPQNVALAIEKARVTFGQAAEGSAPDGRRPAAISLLERVQVRTWLAAMESELAPVASWMPWA